MTDDKLPDPWVPLTDWAHATKPGASEEHPLIVGFDGADRPDPLHVLVTKNPDGSISVVAPRATATCPNTAAWSDVAARLMAWPASRRNPMLPDPFRWRLEVKAWSTARARRARNRRRLAALHFGLALFITGILTAYALAAGLSANWGQAVFFGVLILVAGVWVVEEYRALRRALRPGFRDVVRRRP